MDDLVEFLRARLDEDEQIARDANTSPEMVTGIPRSYASAPVALHIVRHDPARVLAEVDARRGIVDDLAEVIRWAERASLDYQDGADACERTLKRLALPFADHPDYNEAWRL
ncbi:DUF6221 family protein [Streptomyces sp. AM6-12]|uniref:DUF6221 family protein n=1 Tax=Streptomyces sp. AM6-12 TaxID=3345149 RepID=UPI00379B7134